MKNIMLVPTAIFIVVLLSILACEDIASPDACARACHPNPVASVTKEGCFCLVQKTKSVSEGK
jgi:hypothetical protein